MSTAISNSERQELIRLLDRVVGDGPLTGNLQLTAIEAIATLLQQADRAPVLVTPPVATRLKSSRFTDGGDASRRRLVYVHGICRHAAGFSNFRWEALSPFVPTAFGQGTLNQTRLEVVWSDIVNDAAAEFAASKPDDGVVAQAAPDTVDDAIGLASPEEARKRAAAEIKEALRDRADQHILSVAAHRTSPTVANMAGADARSLISIPGLNCIDDFSIYLTNEGIRQQIIDRFLGIVRPELEAEREVDIIAHSWGTVVAYEGLRQLEDEGLDAVRVRNLFTVGAALSIIPVKFRLRPKNRNGHKPACVRRWVNLDAYGDLVGGPLKGRPFEVDFGFVNFEPVGCFGLLGFVSPSCAHNSYFDAANVDVNQNIFANFIDRI
jgi:hypothetical protein